jgi:hypothetical protein
MNTVKRAADSLPAAAMMALVEGRIVEAIRAVREAEDLGFREAKKIVERYIMCDATLRAQWVARREASRQVLGRIVRVMLLLLACYVLYRLFKP